MMKYSNGILTTITNVGGISEARKVAAMAQAAYITVAPHNPNGPLATVESAHLAASIPNFLMLEHRGQIEDVARGEEVVSPPLKLEDGKLLLPEGPGWGMELNEAVRAHYTGPRFGFEPL